MMSFATTQSEDVWSVEMISGWAGLTPPFFLVVCGLAEKTERTPLSLLRRMDEVREDEETVKEKATKMCVRAAMSLVRYQVGYLSHGRRFRTTTKRPFVGSPGHFPLQTPVICLCDGFECYSIDLIFINRSGI